MLAAGRCTSAERPFGLLKKILIDWATRGIRTKEEAVKELERGSYVSQQNKAWRRKKNHGSENYEQRVVKMDNLENLIVDLNEDI